MPHLSKITIKKAVYAIDFLLDYMPQVVTSDVECVAVSSVLDIRKEIIEMADWEAFWLDTNKFDGLIKTPQQWGKIKKLYALDDLKKARCRHKGLEPYYGFRPDFQGSTLEEFFKKNNMKF